MYDAQVVTYFNDFKVWFTLRASASAVAPQSPISFNSRLLKRTLQRLVQAVKKQLIDKSAHRYMTLLAVNRPCRMLQPIFIYTTFTIDLFIS